MSAIHQFIKKKYTTHLYKKPDTNEVQIELLWGDQVSLTGKKRSGRVEVRTRDRRGWVKETDLGGKQLLELYFIDVGQGDGVLIRTPDDRHVFIDGGYKRASQPLGKNAADFVDWKFAKDYRSKTIKIDCLIASHCDADHYGGLWDLLNAKESDELDAKHVVVDAFYHAGVAWQVRPNTGSRWLGRSQSGWLIDLMSDRQSIKDALSASAPGPKLQGEWKGFMKEVVAQIPVVGRLSRDQKWLPGFGPGECPATFKVLGPVSKPVGGRTAVRDFGSDSLNTNGNSILLRLDYGQARILLSGDLNRAAHQSLLKDWSGHHGEFECDVAKACHHGSADVSWKFLKKMRAAATVISSGDNEGHNHPRPSIVAASALSGFQTIDTNKDALKTPLVYSTEISRSVDFGRITAIEQDQSVLEPANGGVVRYTRVQAGALKGKKAVRPLKGAYVVAGVIYGLVNVRTDGKKILCATLNENKYAWEWEAFDARF